MSAGGEGRENLNEEGETPTATLSEVLPKSSKDKIDCSSFKEVYSNTVTLATKADSLEDASQIEALIENKLPGDKEKGLDIDSELDFELKWDDDTDTNENQDIYVDINNTGKDLENHASSIEKDEEKETDSALTSTEKDLDSLDKEENTSETQERDLDSLDEDDSTSKTQEKDVDSLDKDDNISETQEKDLDSLDKDDNISETQDKDVDKETEGILSSINEHLNTSGDEIQQTVSKNKNIDIVDSVNISDNAVPFIDSDLNIIEHSESQVKDIDNESNIILGHSNEDVFNEETTLEEDKIINVDTNTRINTDIKTPQDAETNSLDEQLVYSDAEGSDLEDKDLIDEIDATDITNLDTVNVSSDILTTHKVFDESKTADKDASPMDIDHVVINTQMTVKSVNETDSSTTDMDTSIYDVNNEHSLDKPDVMIDIPTQELIGTFDDADETFDNAEHKFDNLSVSNIINKLDLIEHSKDNADDMTKPIEVEEKMILDEINEDKLLADDEETFNKKLDNTESMEVETIDAKEFDVDFNDTSKETEKVEEHNMANQVTQKADEHSTKDNVSHADIMLEAISEQPMGIISTPQQEELYQEENIKSTDKSDIKQVLPEKEELCKEVNIESAEKSDIKQVLLEKEELSKEVTIESAEKSEVEQVPPEKKDLSTEVNIEFAEKSDIKQVLPEKDELSKEVTFDSEEKSEVKEVPPEKKDLSKEVSIESAEKTEIKEVDTPNIAKDVDEAQPSTSKYHQESSDEDQEASDSLGLLAESSRVMDDDDEQEQEPEPEDDDDDEDFDQDDESNQMTAEHSEDSNAQQSEAEVQKESMEVDESNDANMLMSDVAESNDGLPDETAVTHDDLQIETADAMDDDAISDEKGDLDIQIADVLSHTEVEAVTEATDNLEAAEETQNAVDALLEDEKANESVDVPQAVVRVIEEAVESLQSESVGETSKLRQLLLKDSAENKSPSKTKKLEIAKPKNEINIVELEESSSEDDIQVINKNPLEPGSPKDVTSVTIPSGIEVMAASAGDTSDIQERDGEVKVSGLPKPQPHKPARLNMDELSINTASTAEPMVIPETTVGKTAEPKTPIDFSSEIYSLDSDDDETDVKKRKSKLTAVELDNARQTNKCLNTNCTSDGTVPLVPSSLSAAVYYAANQQRGGGLCLHCAKRFEERCEKLVEGVKDLTPFLSMDMCMIREEFVEISDSDSEDEPDIVKGDDEIIGEKGAKFLEEQLADMFNDTWKKFNMEERLLSAQAEINVEVSHLEEECKQIDAMLEECQKETDKLRNDLYSTFADDRTELPSIAIVDTPTNQWCGVEDAPTTPATAPETKERPKRRSASAIEPPAKRAAIPLGYEPIDRSAGTIKPEVKPAPITDSASQNDDDNADISVVKLSVESAPAGLPPPGVPARAPLRAGMPVFAMRNSFGAWHRVRVQEVQPRLAGQFTICRVRFEQPKPLTKMLPARCLAYEQPPDVRLTIGTRVVALFKDHRVNVEMKEEGEKKEAYYSGIVAEIPNPVNNFRYLIFFDDGYAQYVQHANTRLVCECAPRVWDEVHPFSRNFVRDYLRAYPERPMVRLHAGQSIKTEWDGKWWVSKVLQVDASLVLVYFEGKKDNKTEWIYRGSTRLAPLYLELQAAERTRARPLPRAQAARRFNMPYVEYTRSDETDKEAPAATPEQTPAQIQACMEQEIRRQRAVAKKSTALPPAPAAPAPAPTRDNVTSRVVFYTPKNAIRPHKMVPHTCGPRCKRTDVLALKDLRTYNPLTKPLLSGWERQTVRYRIPAVKAVMYRAPCGRRIRNYEELHKYLQAIDSDMGVDLFDFNPATHCLAEFLLNKCLISKKDLSHGKENVPVPCVNYYDSSLPEFCSYNTERTPTAGVPLNLDPEFLCGCDCTDDCADKSKCACWKMTLEGARTIGLDTSEVGYVYKRLPEPLPSGIYECNSRCKCKQTCLNRVAQHPLQLKLQVFKTANRGWGIRALNDVPKGAFLCVYAGNLLTDATANLDGLNEGDEYLAELDYIEVVEQMKEGFEEDIPEDAKKLDEEEDESSSMSSSDEEPEKRDEDDDFRPALPSGQYAPSEYSKRLRKREKSKKAKEKEAKEKERKQREKDGGDCITISDDEELREPAHFSAQPGMGGKNFISKYKSVRTLFGKDEACYIMDAKVQGNIGRYLNHSCTPNVFVQNVFVDTHDPRFPWVAFFALSQIRAGTELTWNYNYDVGSVPGKVLYCYCNAPNCRGRLL